MAEPGTDSPSIPRREFLRRSLLFGAGVSFAGLLAACGASPSGASESSAPARGAPSAGAIGPVLPEDVPPDLALRTLLEGNARYAAERSIHPNLSAERRQELSLGQRPWASILGCSDSRVPPELVFDVGPGDMFDVREAGNVASAVSLESLTYSVEHLHSRLILVLGHTSCGAVHAVFEDQAQEYPEIEHLIKPAIAGIDDEFSAVKANALAQRQTMADHPALAEEIGSGHIEVHAAYFDLATGRVTLLAA